MPRQAKFWIITLSYAVCPQEPQLSANVVWLKGQREIGEGGFEHWQFVCSLHKKGSVHTLQGLWPGCHAEATRSDAADEYVHKEDSRVPDTQFEYGRKPFRRNVATDWDEIWASAVNGDIMAVPANVRVQHYRTLRQISSDNAIPLAMERSCNVFIGGTGTGKSRRAWDEAGLDAYPKDPRTKFWCGYSAQVNVIIDEFRGGIDVAHLLRWLDRYPVIVEIKGSSTVLRARTFWITSNVPVDCWYPGLDNETYLALVRRLTIVEF